MFRIGRKDPQPQQASSEPQNPKRKELFGFRRGVSAFIDRVAKGNAEQSSQANRPSPLNERSFELIEGAGLNDLEIDDFEMIGEPEKEAIEELDDSAVSQWLERYPEDPVESKAEGFPGKLEKAESEGGVGHLGPQLLEAMWEFHEDQQLSPVQRIDQFEKKVLSLSRLEAPVEPKAPVSIPEARNALFDRLPTGTIKEKTLISGFKYVREHIETVGVWRVSGEAAIKATKLATMDRRIFPKVPEFTAVTEATDVLKVLIGAVKDKNTTPYLEHSLSYQQFVDLSDKAEKEALTVAEMDAVLKAAFGNDQKKLVMFKALLVLLKEASEHADVNKMTVENLITCPLNALLQRNVDPSKIGQFKYLDLVKNFNLGTFLINNADEILVDI